MAFFAHALALKGSAAHTLIQKTSTALDVHSVASTDHALCSHCLFRSCSGFYHMYCTGMVPTSSTDHALAPAVSTGHALAPMVHTDHALALTVSTSHALAPVVHTDHALAFTVFTDHDPSPTVSTTRAL